MKKPTSKPTPAVFIDRDGVLNEDKGYVSKVEDLVVLPTVPESLLRLKKRGFLLIIITNQSGIARGYFRREDADRFHTALQQRIIELGGTAWDALYMCPHHPSGVVGEFAIDCACRKPKPGLLEQARQDYAINWDASFLIGDKDSDVACGKAVGIRTIQITSDQYTNHAEADCYVNTMAEAVDYIIKVSTQT